MLRSLLALLLSGWAVVATAAPLGPEDARHLLNRAGFGASLVEVETFARLTRAQATERLLTVKGSVLPEPDWVREPYFPPGRFSTLDAETRTRLQAERIERSIGLREWWLRQMLVTPDPLRERMTLFWHNHFVSGLQKVQSPQLMYRQNVLLREHALGNFGTLLHAVARDPAMLRYLDSAFNRKGRPNENFARELMELFTLGEGHYTEQDVKEVARAFTGWSLNPDSGGFMFRPALHDDGPKAVLGRAGNFGGDEVLDILLERPETATLIARKLWIEFVSPQPAPAEVARIAGALRSSGYDIRAALRVLFNSDAFYAPANRGVLIKSPVDLVAGTLRQFEFEVPDVLPFVFAMGQFGQVLFAPPNVKGWPGGDLWINATTLLQRKQLLDTLFQDRLAVGAGMGMMAAAATPAATPDAARRARARLAMSQVRFDGEAWLKRLNNVPPARAVLAVAPVHAAGGTGSGMDDLRALVLDPAYQLK